MNRTTIRAVKQSRALPLCLAALTTTIALLLVLAPAASAAVCGRTVAYPGDDATKEQHANWMANGAVVRGIPGELPVMAALVESGLKNLNYGDRDSVGFFQMRTSIWNKGEYKGYLQKPNLQLKWFTDTAAKVRLQYIIAGRPDPANDPASYGVWIADVERPAAQYRGRYQKRLGEARALVAATCPNLQKQDPNALRVYVSIPNKQRSHRSGAIVARLRCPAEPCNAYGSAIVRLPGKRKLLRLSSDTMMLPTGKRGAVRVTIRRALRKRFRRALARGEIRARLRVTITDTLGRGKTRTEKIRIVR
ncbi:MAG: hypothetical protein ACPGYP_06815 [Solirubrobacterales bacterium]